MSTVNTCKNKGASSADSGALIAREILLQGRVQGFGVRPAIARLAIRLQLDGTVVNTAAGVVIHLEGMSSAINEFQSLLPDALPALADFQIHCVNNAPFFDHSDFRIASGSDSNAAAVDVPVDLAMCPACANELTDHTNRRFEYAFSSCTACGPRYSIIRAMPYERRDTAMVAYPLCSNCNDEYHDSDDRRFHAQTIACQNCGPVLWFESDASPHDCGGTNALAAAIEILRTGGILALKGVGGYQLLCDATNTKAVQRLREKKHRQSKPLAVMIPNSMRPDFFAVRSHGADVEILNSPTNPIVILKNFESLAIAPEVHPELNSIGVMLPTTPLHALLLNEMQTPLVVTSGNRDSEPLAFEEIAARKSLASIADGWLHHDRKIERPVDDSVVRTIAGHTVTIRAGRGIAPLRLPFQTRHSILAVGGEQKVACAVSNGHQVVLGPHIGDMSSLDVRQRFVEQIVALITLYGAKPSVIAHDLHPDYFTSRWSAEQGLRTIAIQHHHAHIVSGMLQHGFYDQQVLGVAFDGTGYGTDGTIWGGEFLLASKSSFKRVATLTPFALPGGDAAIREPWRVAVALLTAAIPEMTAERIEDLLKRTCRRQTTETHALASVATSVDKFPSLVQIRQVQQLVGFDHCPQTSSMGRLFDGVASVLLGIAASGFEGEPAMRLEAACHETVDNSGKQITRCLLEVSKTAEHHVDWRPVVRNIVADLQEGLPASVIAMKFHLAMARAVGLVVAQFPDYPVVLSGGCFQNRILAECVVKELERHDRIVAAPATVPPNDGGLAAGQIAIAAALLEAEEYQETQSCA
jgi:hydrogenase maturation protein HypF